MEHIFSKLFRVLKHNARIDYGILQLLSNFGSGISNLVYSMSLQYSKVPIILGALINIFIYLKYSQKCMYH